MSEESFHVINSDGVQDGDAALVGEAEGGADPPPPPLVPPAASGNAGELAAPFQKYASMLKI